MAIDRKSRDDLVSTIDRYCHDEITAFEFDEAIFDIRGRTSDDTVKRVVDFLWYFYDDCQDHQVHLDRVGWNLFQRLRLLLTSDAVLECSKRRVWSTAQIIAAIALAVFAWAAYKTGVGEHLLLVAIPFGLASITLSLWRRRAYRKALDCDMTLYPFASVGQLLWVGQGVPDFRRERYRPEIAARHFRDAGSRLALYMQMYVPWLLFGPVALIGQVFPMSVPVREVVP